MLEDDSLAWDEIGQWIEAARVVQVMEHNRLGLMGHYYSGMMDIYSDLTQLCACFGGFGSACSKSRTWITCLLLPGNRQFDPRTEQYSAVSHAKVNNAYK